VHTQLLILIVFLFLFLFLKFQKEKHQQNENEVWRGTAFWTYAPSLTPNPSPQERGEPSREWHTLKKRGFSVLRFLNP
jgi:hypothetical protein